MPIGADLGLVPASNHRFEFGAEFLLVGYPIRKPCPNQGPNFALRDVEPASRFGCVMALEPGRQSPRFCRWKGGIERGIVVGVEVVFDQLSLSPL